MSKDFSDVAWSDYLWIVKNNKSLLKKLNRKIKSIDRHGYSSIGHLENLKGRPGWHSLTLDKKNRLVFRIHNHELQIHNV